METTQKEKFISDAIKKKYGIEKNSGLPIKLDDLIVKNFKLIQPCRIYGGMANKNKLMEFIDNKLDPVIYEGVPIRFYINANAAIRYNKANENPRNILSVLRNFGTTEKTKTYLKNLEIYYDYPKPVPLIEYLIKIGCEDNEGIILDFFAGSATTAEAVINTNADMNSRKFICIQLPEKTYDGPMSSIADIGKERIRRVINRINKDQKGKLDFDGVSKQNRGFKVMKLDRSNFKVWEGAKPDATPEEIARQLEMFVEHINPEATQEDILYELLLKCGYMPTEKIEELCLANKTVYAVADKTLFVCLENEITGELINAVAEAGPLQFICLDKGFKGNDQLKANAVQTFAARNQGRDKAEQIVFRTV